MTRGGGIERVFGELRWGRTWRMPWLDLWETSTAKPLNSPRKGSLRDTVWMGLDKDLCS